MRWLLLSLVLVACGATPVNPSPSYGGAASVGGQTGTCDEMCEHIEPLGCAPKTCLEDCRRLTSDARFGLDIDCRLRAASKSEVQACGPASCRE